MTFNSQEIIQDIRAEFENLLDFVSSEEARTAKADQIERGLFKMLLNLGAKLLQLFFTMRSEICCRQAVQSASGEELSYHRDIKRVYFSIFNKVFLERPYFYKQGVGSQIPLDAELGRGVTVTPICCEKPQNTLRSIMCMVEPTPVLWSVYLDSVYLRERYNKMLLKIATELKRIMRKSRHPARKVKLKF